MNRDEALELVKKYLKNKNLVKHCLAVEACMRKLAKRFGEDEEKWGLAGLIHDLDYEITQKSPELHTTETLKILAPYNLDKDIIHAIQAHAGKAPCENKMDWSIFSADPLTGLIVAATLMHPSRKIKKVDTGFLMRRFKEKSFARGANREEIKKCIKLGLELEEFMEICLEAMQEISEELGL